MARRNGVWTVICWSVVQGTPVVPMAIARAQDVPARVVRDCCRRAEDAGLLEQEGQAHEYRPAVELVRTDDLPQDYAHYIADIRAEARGEFDRGGDLRGRA